MFPRSRGFSTAAKVYPGYLPHLRHTRRMPSKWIKPLAGLLVVGVGLRTYTSSTRDQRIAEVQAADRYDAERRRQNELMDQYGARDSLEELEKAVAMYEKRQ